MTHPLRKTAIALRLSGKSYTEIYLELGINKSTLSYMLKDVPLTRDQQVRLHAKVAEASKRGLDAIASLPPEIRKLRGQKSLQTRIRRRITCIPYSNKPTPVESDFDVRPIEIPRSLNTDTYRICLGNARFLPYKTNWNHVRGYGKYLAAPCLGHPAENNQESVYVHRIVMEHVLGRLLSKDEIVHHINKDRFDNRIENLELTNQSDHSRHHSKPTTMVDLTCASCGCSFQRRKGNDPKVKGYKFAYCSRRCAGAGPKT